MEDQTSFEVGIVALPMEDSVVRRRKNILEKKKNTANEIENTHLEQKLARRHVLLD